VNPAASPPGLAPTQAVFRARALEVNLFLMAGIIGAGMGLAALAFGGWASVFATMTYGPAAVARWAGPWFTVAPVLLGIGITCLARAWWVRRLWIEVFADGLRVNRGRKAEWMAWTAVRQIRTRSAGRRGLVYAAVDLRLDDGRRLLVTRTLASLDALVDLVKRRALPALLEGCRRRFNQGEPLSFGPINLTSVGVQVGKKLLQWGEVEMVEVHAGRLVITAHAPGGMRLQTAADRVPNIDVCVQLVRLLGQVP